MKPFACSARITQANQLCGLEIDRFKAALADGVPITVACTQEAPLFREMAEDLAPSPALTFVNIRETAGWSKDAAAAGPKAAALIAAASVLTPPIALVTLEHFISPALDRVRVPGASLWFALKKMG